MIKKVYVIQSIRLAFWDGAECRFRGFAFADIYATIDVAEEAIYRAAKEEPCTIVGIYKKF